VIEKRSQGLHTVLNFYAKDKGKPRWNRRHWPTVNSATPVESGPRHWSDRSMLMMLQPIGADPSDL
jgi:hypothetical protein